MIGYEKYAHVNNTQYMTNGTSSTIIFT